MKLFPAVSTLLLGGVLWSTLVAATDADDQKHHNEETVAQLQAEMAAGKLTSEELTKEYIARIMALDHNGPGVNAVIELNPDATPATKCRLPPVRLRCSAGRPSKIQRWPPTCARAER